VYGLNNRGGENKRKRKRAFRESDLVDRPANLYGATKRSNEQLAFAYHNLHGLRSVGCRFFTVKQETRKAQCARSFLCVCLVTTLPFISKPQRLSNFKAHPQHPPFQKYHSQH
jgi:nucleoside-diphosphate-sugar epimerase